MCKKKSQNKVRHFKILEEPALSDCQATIVVRSNVVTLSSCQNFGNFSTNNAFCHHTIAALQRAPWPFALSHNSQNNSIFMYPQTLKIQQRHWKKISLSQSYGMIFRVHICWVCYSMLKDAGLHFHQFPYHYCQKKDP